MMFLDSENVTFIEILIRPSFSTKSAGMPSFYRVKPDHNKISTKLPFLESGIIRHECPAESIPNFVQTYQRLKDAGPMSL